MDRKHENAAPACQRSPREVVGSMRGECCCIITEEKNTFLYILRRFSERASDTHEYSA
jgi:hypothetical protein